MSGGLCAKHTSCNGKYGAGWPQHQEPKPFFFDTSISFHCAASQVQQCQAKAEAGSNQDTVASSCQTQYVSRNSSSNLLYVGLMLHAETRKRGLVDRLFSLGLIISYDRVLRLSAQMGNSVCQLYHIEQVVCPPTLRSNVFTTAAVDNIDHNPSATTAKNSFHGTGISVLQHPTCADEGVARSIALTGLMLDQRRISLYQNITRM